jgi:hypothetical protein
LKAIKVKRSNHGPLVRTFADVTRIEDVIQHKNNPQKTGNGPGNEDPPHGHLCQLGSLIPAKLCELNAPVENDD